MHFTGTVWRPPYEASSMLLEVTAGCTHHRCKFCTLYNGLPFPFRMSPLEDIEEDLKETLAQRKVWKEFLLQPVRRTFLVGANPFVLEAGRLLEIARLVRRYFPSNQTVGCFARVTDIALKTDAELLALREAGYDGITIGIETGDNEALEFMDKGYGAGEILAQCRRLDAVDMYYNFFYLTGISGAGKGEAGARATAALCNRLRPKIIGASMLTVYPDSALWQEAAHGRWQEETELEKYRELRALVEGLEIPVWFGALGASNAIPLQGHLPGEKGAVLAALDEIIGTADEAALREYRETLPHL